MDGLFAIGGGVLQHTWGDALRATLQGAKVVVVDGNLSSGDLRLVVAMCTELGIDVWFEPTSIEKCARIVEAGVMADVRYFSPNEAETVAMADAVMPTTAANAKLVSQEVCNGRASKQHVGDSDGHGRPSDTAVDAAARAILNVPQQTPQTIFVTRGARGMSRFDRRGDGGNEVIRSDFAAVRVPNVVNTTGAGDCFAGGCVAALAAGKEQAVAILEGMKAGAACCESEDVLPRRELVKGFGQHGVSIKSRL